MNQYELKKLDSAKLINKFSPVELLEQDGVYNHHLETVDSYAKKLHPTQPKFINDIIFVSFAYTYNTKTKSNITKA